MLLHVADCPDRVAADVYLNIEGGLSIEHSAYMVGDTLLHGIDFSIADLTREFIRLSIDPETKRIECNEAEHLYNIINAFKQAVTLLENAVYEDEFPQADPVN